MPELNMKLLLTLAISTLLIACGGTGENLISKSGTAPTSENTPEAPDTQSSDTQSSETQGSETQGSETQGSETQSSEPENTASETNSPTTDTTVPDGTDGGIYIETPEEVIPTEEVLIAKGEQWRYYSASASPGDMWMLESFDDSAWRSGLAQLGYGDGDEATSIRHQDKPMAYYFRHQFTVQDTSSYKSLIVDLLRDDGAVIYLNGEEILRDNMPAEQISHDTAASGTVSGGGESLFQRHQVSALELKQGSNTLAVSVHQSNLSSSDVSFDMALIGSNVPYKNNRVTEDGQVGPVTRGAYLQQLTSSSVIVRWRTAEATDSVLYYGEGRDAYTGIIEQPGSRTEHELKLENLDPNTVYSYAIADSNTATAKLWQHSYFKTAPVSGSHEPVTVWVIGDSGTASTAAKRVYNAYMDQEKGETDVWLMLGDNAYGSGTDAEYQRAVFDHYPELLQQTAVWSTFGNHDAASANSGNESGVYYDIFSFPRNGEAGGVASGTEAYYSFDHGNVHFVCLDSQGSNRAVGSDMLTWLEADLQSTGADWVIAFWHHPPYTKGSHDSDTESRLVQMRQNVLPILESYGVDLVLGGHSHAYERSKLIDSHYGHSSTYSDNEHAKNAGSGRADQEGVYAKTLGAANDGAVYAVAGSSGKLSGGTIDHPVMYTSMKVMGSMVLEIEGTTLNARFIDQVGDTRDYFTIQKN